MEASVKIGIAGVSDQRSRTFKLTWLGMVGVSSNCFSTLARTQFTGTVVRTPYLSTDASTVIRMTNLPYRTIITGSPFMSSVNSRLLILTQPGPTTETALISFFEWECKRFAQHDIVLLF